jgi:hypothetical protein
MAFRSSSGLSGATSTSAAIPVPTGAAVDDIAVVGVYKENTNAIGTVPSGFTLKASMTTSGASRGTLYVYWKRLTAADSGTYTFGWSGGGANTFRAGACALFSGCITTGDPFDGTVGTAESTTTVATLNVSTSPTGSGGDAIGFWTNFTGGNSYTPPTNYTERQDLDVICLDTRDAVASGSTGSISATSIISGFQKAFLGVLAAASSGTTGTAAPTEANDTSSASGQLGYSGTSAATEAADTSSATGTVANPVTGSAAVAQANQTATASGVLQYTGTAATSQSSQTSTASGQLGYSGTSAVTQANQTSAASGTYTAGGSFSGIVAVTQASQTSAASGQLGYSGTSARTQANQTSSATGSFAGGTSGSAAVTQANQFSIANGVLRYSGTSAATQAPNTSASVGTVANPVTGSIAVVQANQTSAVVALFEALVTFGTASAGVGLSPSSHPNLGLAPCSLSASGSVPSAVGVTASAPTSTGA